MIRPSTLPAPRAGVLVLGPIRQDDLGISYRAWSPGEGDAMTLWVDARRVDDDPARAERLARQAFALERVRHPNLAEVVRFDDHGGRLSVVERPGTSGRNSTRPPYASMTARSGSGLPSGGR